MLLHYRKLYQVRPLLFELLWEYNNVADVSFKDLTLKIGFFFWYSHGSCSVAWAWQQIGQ